MKTPSTVKDTKPKKKAKLIKGEWTCAVIPSAGKGKLLLGNQPELGWCPHPLENSSLALTSVAQLVMT